VNSRSDLIETATRVFAARGYNGTSVRDIAQAAGIQRGSLYHHIASKEQLLLEGLLPALEGATIQVESVVESSLQAPKPDYESSLREALRTHLQCLYGNTLLEGVKIYLAENLLSPHSELSDAAKKRLRELTVRHEANFTRLFEAGVRAGVFRRDMDPKLQSFLVLGACNWLSRWYRSDGRWSLDLIAEQVADTTLGGCLVQKEKVRDR
jgi:AcrR family transcriptional regulator